MVERRDRVLSSGKVDWRETVRGRVRTGKVGWRPACEEDEDEVKRAEVREVRDLEVVEGGREE